MKIYIYLFFSFLSQSLFGQFTGGDGDGLAFTPFIPVINTYYHGGDTDGFHVVKINGALAHYTGGEADGFSFEKINGSNAYYTGGDTDGFSFDKINGANFVYQGGDADGFVVQNLYTDYIWTGTIGTGWNVTDNWSTNQIPTLRHNVIIPAGVPNFPFVNSGTLSIGSNPNNAQYLCDALLVQSNAQLTTRVTCFVTVFGRFVVKGDLFVKNSAADAFVVKKNGEFKINGGEATMGF